MEKLLEANDNRSISYLVCKDKNNCTLIFESGLGDGHQSWLGIIEKVKSNYSYLAYDRAGLGSSSELRNEQTLENIFGDLKSILDFEKLKPPYIFVGHSYGGALIKSYATHFKDDDIGFVFVDASDSSYEEYILSYRSDKQKEFWMEAMGESAPKELIGVNRELKYYRGVLAKADSLYISPNIPSAILVCDNIMGLNYDSRTSMFPEEFAPFKILERDNLNWVDIHKNWTKKHHHSKFIEVLDCSHYIHKDKPEVVVDAIEWVVNSIFNNKVMNTALEN